MVNPVCLRDGASLLADLLSGHTERALERIRSGDTAGFAAFLQHQNVTAWALSVLDRDGFRACFTDDVAARLERDVERRWRMQEAAVAALPDIAEALERAGEAFLLLKGPYLSVHFFGSLERRAFRDLDLLVRPDRLAAVERVLRNAGYRRRSWIPLGRSLTARFAHAFDFERSDVKLDLHWTLGSHGSFRLDGEAVWQERGSWTFAGRRYAVLSDGHEVSLAALAILRDLERGAARLKSFVDLYRILEAVDRRLDWQRFFERRRRERIARICATVLGMVLDLFEARANFPAVAEALDRTGAVPLSPRQTATLLEAPRGSPRSKVAVAKIYEGAVVGSLGWWILSLPFRFAVYRAGPPVLRRRLCHLFTARRGRAE